MKTKDLLYAMGGIDVQWILDAAPDEAVPKGKTGKRRWVIPTAVAAGVCAVLVSVSAVSTLARNIALTDDSYGVRASYAWFVPKQEKTADLLAYMTEEELFCKWDTVVFRGTVTSIENIVLNFDGLKEYRALVELEVSETYRGEVGEKVTLLLPCPIGNGVRSTDTDTVDELKVGMSGIFMPLLYDETSVISMNGASLALLDIADGAFPDGVRYAFLEGKDGLIFDGNAYPSLTDAETLDEIEAYVKEMIQKTE
ncbi:MAG: hypothetical protein IJW55_02875 [Clostridia bacterium]|nr:hypothetical protein [Clostridia bacterium]